MRLLTHLNIRSISFLWYPSSRAIGITAFDWPGTVLFGVKTLGEHALPISIPQYRRRLSSSRRFSDVFVVRKCYRHTNWCLKVSCRNNCRDTLEIKTIAPAWSLQFSSKSKFLPRWYQECQCCVCNLQVLTIKFLIATNGTSAEIKGSQSTQHTNFLTT